MVALMRLVMSPVVNPILPYWLYFRYRVSRIAGNLRAPALQRHYRFLIRQKAWETEQWVVISPCQPKVGSADKA